MIWRSAFIALLIFSGAANAELTAPIGIGGPGFKIIGESGTGGGPPPLVVPMVQVNTCNITTPVTNGVNVTLVLGGNCTYTATCNGGACIGGNAISTWAITTQSTANAFSITSGGTVQGGSAAASVTLGNSYTVTVTATNPNGASAPVVETINAPPVPAAPVVASITCSISTPVTNGSPVALAAGGNCTFTATCASLACTGVNTITSWAVFSQSLANAFSINSSGVALGGTNAASVVNSNTYTMNVTATNSTGTSSQAIETLDTPGFDLNSLLLEAGLPNFLLLEDGVSHLCLEAGC